MRHPMRLYLSLSLLLIAAACAPQSSPPPPPTVIPTPTISPAERVNSNADWTPVTREFDGVSMVRVPVGCFTMGQDTGRRNERPQHEQCFSAPYWIDQYEVTNGQYGTDSVFPGENRPYTNLTWFEARDYCAARGARLPNEAEWEYAARGPSNLIYPWGDTLDTQALVFDQNSGNQAAEVGSRPRGVSWVGAYDMSGNVLEWVSSQYRRYPYNPFDGREDLTNATALRVYRSGWGSYIDYGVSAAKRFFADPNYRDWFIGLRCVRDAQPGDLEG